MPYHISTAHPSLISEKGLNHTFSEIPSLASTYLWLLCGCRPLLCPSFMRLKMTHVGSTLKYMKVEISGTKVQNEMGWLQIGVFPSGLGNGFMLCFVIIL